MYSDMRLPKEFTDEDRRAMEKLTPIQQQLYIQIKSKQFQNLQKPEGFDTRMHAQGTAKQTIYSNLKVDKNDGGQFPSGMPSYMMSLKNKIGAEPVAQQRPLVNSQQERVGSMGMTDHEKYEFMKYGLGGAVSYMR